MPKMKLTARGVTALKAAPGAKQTDFYDQVVPGLVLRVGSGGSRVYVVRYRSGGRHRRMKLGTTASITLAKARDKARDAIEQAQDGADPAAERAADAPLTFRQLAEEALRRKAGKTRAATRRERQRILDADLLPVWGDRDAASITRREVLLHVEAIAERAPVVANRTLSLIRLIYNVGLERAVPGIENNPAHKLKPPGAENGRDRYLTRDEMRAVWAATAWETPIMKGIFRLALLTAQRVGSVCALRWSDIDDTDVWAIPAEVFKGKRSHLVPLSKQALAVLKELRPLTGEGTHVFPSRFTDDEDGHKPHVVSTNKAMQRVRERTDIPAWTVHDFRTTFRTHATRAAKPAHKRDPAGLGVAPTIADAVLGHKEASLGFDRYTAEPERYLVAEKRAALKLWGAFVAAAVAEDAS